MKDFLACIASAALGAVACYLWLEYRNDEAPSVYDMQRPWWDAPIGPTINVPISPPAGPTWPFTDPALREPATGVLEWVHECIGTSYPIGNNSISVEDS